MKSLKKISALALSLLLILTAVFIPATITAAAETEELDPKDSLIYGIASSWSSYNGTGLMYNSSDNMLLMSTDGDTSVEHNYYSATGTKIVWMLEKRTSIETFALWFSETAKYEFEFELYIGSNSSDLFTDNNKAYTHTVTAEGETYSRYLEVTFDEPKTGILVGMSITDTAAAGGDTTARIHEFGVYGTAAPETDGTYYTNKFLIMSQQANLHSKSIIAGFTPYSTTRAATPNSAGTTISPSNTGYLTDGDYSSCYNLPKTDVSGNASQPWVQITYKLDTLYKVDGFTFYGAHETFYLDFEIYVGTDLSTLYEGTPVAKGSTHSDTDGYNFGTQIVLADNTVANALYVGFAVKQSSSTADYTSRIKEIQVFGEKTSGTVDRWAVASDATEESLLLGRGLEATSVDKNTLGSEWSYSNTSATYTYLQNPTRITDGKVSTEHSDVTNSTNSKLIWKLEKTTDIKSFLLYNHSSQLYFTAYEVYASDSLATLFDSANLLYSYTFRDSEGNVDVSKVKAGGQYVDFYGDNINSANYVAVWIREGAIIELSTDSETGVTTGTVTNSGIRISELAFFGTESANATANGKLYAATRTDESTYENVAAQLGNDSYTYENSLLKASNLTVKAGIDGSSASTNTETAELTDGTTKSQEMYLHYTSYNDFTYYLGAPTEVTAFMHIKNNSGFTEGYKVYVGYSADTLFTDENLVLDMSNISVLPRVYTTAVTFGTPKKGLYLGIRYTGVSSGTALRIAEVAAWGVQEDLGYELTPSIAAASDASSVSEYDNLLKGLVGKTGYYGSVRSNGIDWIDGITDGVANLHYDMNYTPEYGGDASEILYDLGYTSTVYEFAYWMTCAGHQFSYQVYMGDSYDTMFAEPVFVWDYRISPDSVGQKFVLDEPMQVRYVAIRMGETRVDGDSYRTSEIAVYGTRNEITADSLVELDKVDIEAVEDPTYITYTSTFTFPAGQLDGNAQIIDMGTLVYPTTALNNSGKDLTLDFEGAAIAKATEAGISEVQGYDEAGYTAVSAKSTFNGLRNVGATTKLTAVSYVTVKFADGTETTYYSNAINYSKTQMKRLAAKELKQVYENDYTFNYNDVIETVWSAAMASKENRSANKSTAVTGAEKWLTDVKTQYSLEQEWLDNGLVTMGDTSRISAVIRKLMRGESVTVVGLGGSITEGYFSGEGSEQSRRVADFLNAAFPEQVTFVNAGISATGAVSAAHRLQADVLSANPDLVILEYAVNDNNRDAVAIAAYENVVRNLLSKDVAILALHNVTYSDSRMTATGSGKNHENIGTVYDLPQVSAVDAFFGTSIYAKGSDTTEYYYGTANNPTDGTHPNEKGHAASGALMANLILNIMKNIETQPTESAAMPTAPMYPDGNYINVDTATIVKAETISEGDTRVTVSGVEYTALATALGQGGSDIRANNTYNGYYAIAGGTTATFTLNNVTDAFFVMLQSAAGSETGVFTATAADGTVLSTGTLDSYYVGALTEEDARIINTDTRVYHGEAATVTVTVTVPEGANPAYIGGVMGCFN